MAQPRSCLIVRIAFVVPLFVLTSCARNAVAPPAPAGQTPPAIAVDPPVPILAERCKTLFDTSERVDPEAARLQRTDFAVEPISMTPPTLEVKKAGRLTIQMVRGGRPVSCCSRRSQSVSSFLGQTGGVAGLNGTFFDFYPIGRGKQYRDRALIGPWMTGSDLQFHPESRPDVLERLRNRPLLVWGKSSLAIFPFQPETMNSLKSLRAVMPDLTDTFLAGAWLVHEGKGSTAGELEKFGPNDVNTPRYRAFVGMNGAGEFVLGATTFPTNSERLSKALVGVGLREAVLVDSGMSTCLIYEGRQVAFGHRNHKPSRIVPHAICLLAD